MACKTVLSSVIAFKSSVSTWSFYLPASSSSFGHWSATAKKLNYREIFGARDFLGTRRARINCCHKDEGDQGPPQETVLKVISEVSKTDGRVGQTTNVVIGGTVTDDTTNEWLALDQKVNSYPSERSFTAIGTGGDDFVQAMVVAVESVIQQSIPEERVTQTLSSKGKYVSVRIGPIRVVSSEQVQAIYNAMRSDTRMKYFL